MIDWMGSLEAMKLRLWSAMMEKEALLRAIGWACDEIKRLYAKIAALGSHASTNRDQLLQGQWMRVRHEYSIQRASN